MRCPFCAAYEDKVIETRVSKDGNEIRRRRECEGCSRRYTTYERIEESMPLVVKNDGRREPFDRHKIEHGLVAAVAKRSISLDQVKALALEVEREISELGVSEIASRQVGERVLPRLHKLDQVAYVRFASIYRDFRDLDEFAKELDQLRGEREDTDEHEPVEPIGASPTDVGRAAPPEAVRSSIEPRTRTQRDAGSGPVRRGRAEPDAELEPPRTRPGTVDEPAAEADTASLRARAGRSERSG